VHKHLAWLGSGYFLGTYPAITAADIQNFRGLPPREMLKKISLAGFFLSHPFAVILEDLIIQVHRQKD
jgi:hypothetical protein